MTLAPQVEIKNGRVTLSFDTRFTYALPRKFGTGRALYWDLEKLRSDIAADVLFQAVQYGLSKPCMDSASQEKGEVNSYAAADARKGKILAGTATRRGPQVDIDLAVCRDLVALAAKKFGRKCDKKTLQNIADCGHKLRGVVHEVMYAKNPEVADEVVNEKFETTWAKVQPGGPLHANEKALREAMPLAASDFDF